MAREGESRTFRRKFCKLCFDKVERIDRLENGRALRPTGKLAVSQEDAGACEGLRIQPAFPSLDAEQRVELCLPLPKKRLGYDQKHSAHAFGHELRDH